MKKTVTLHPSRIGCPSIPGTMKGIVSSLHGVSDVKVRYEERALDVTFDEDATTSDAIVSAVGSELGLAMEVAETGAKKEEDVSKTCPM